MPIVCGLAVCERCDDSIVFPYVGAALDGVLAPDTAGYESHCFLLSGAIVFDGLAVAVPHDDLTIEPEVTDLSLLDVEQEGQHRVR